MSTKAYKMGNATCGLHLELQKWWFLQKRKRYNIDKIKKAEAAL